VVAVGTTDQIRRAGDELERALAFHAQIATFPVRGAPGQWGLIARAAAGTKGTALRWLAAHHGVDPQQTVVVGDWHNDISMFLAAGRSYAMGHAPEDVKKFASSVLRETALEGGGVARVVSEVFGIRV